MVAPGKRLTASIQAPLLRQILISKFNLTLTKGPIWEKSVFQVTDTSTHMLDNTRPFLHSSIVSFWVKKINIKITFLGNAGAPETFQCSPILGCSSI